MGAHWWDQDARERLWVEITDRDVIGEDLWAPQMNEGGRPYWSYEMVTWIPEGDAVLHFRTNEAAFTAWSRAAGSAHPDQIEWGAHGYASGRGPVSPYDRPAWLVPLDGPFPIDPPVTMVALQRRESEITRVYNELQSVHPAPYYFPFQLSRKRPMRAFQGYMTKMPRALMDSLPELQPVLREIEQSVPTARRPAPRVSATGLGADYRAANEQPTTPQQDPHAVDPNLIDRALAGHARTQNALAALLVSRGITPRSPSPGEPAFDIAWEDDGSVCVAEIKSLTETNEEKQLRLGLGQVLRYGHQLQAKSRAVRRFLVTERKPRDESWSELCEAHGVLMCWAPDFNAINGISGV